MQLLSRFQRTTAGHADSPHVRVGGLEEFSLRRASFIEGIRIRLADGQAWSFAGRTADPGAPAYDAMLRAVEASEDRADLLRAELAMAIFLLSRSYEVGPGDYASLLGYREGDPDLERMQRDFHAFAMEQLKVARDERGR